VAVVVSEAKKSYLLLVPHPHLVVGRDDCRDAVHVDGAVCAVLDDEDEGVVVHRVDLVTGREKEERQ